MIVSQSTTAIRPNLTCSFAVTGAVGAVTYSIKTGGAGGTINSSGIYQAPAKIGADTIIATDTLLNQAMAIILIGTPEMLVCDIIQNQMGLAPGRVYLWDQKIKEPTDSSLYAVVQVLSCKPFGSGTTYDGSGSGLNAIQSVNFLSTLSLDIKSRGPDARDRKEEIVMALTSPYAEYQMAANSFKIGKLPSSFMNLSQEDGAAIPYRFNISVAIQYAVTKTLAVPYYGIFQGASIITNQ